LLEFKIAGLPPNQAFLDWVGPARGVPADNLRGFRSDSYDLIRDRALLDDYVALVPLFVLAEDIRRGSLVQAPLQWPGVYECWMLMTRERAQAPEMKVLAEVARKAGRSIGGLPAELACASGSAPTVTSPDLAEAFFVAS
jgi:DNA-binding transcriptional LysR family regulator